MLLVVIYVIVVVVGGGDVGCVGGGVLLPSAAVYGFLSCLFFVRETIRKFIGVYFRYISYCSASFSLFSILFLCFPFLSQTARYFFSD